MQSGKLNLENGGEKGEREGSEENVIGWIGLEVEFDGGFKGGIWQEKIFQVF